MSLYYRRNLSHYNPQNRPIFITFRLTDSLPIDIINRLKVEREKELKNAHPAERYTIEKRFFARFDNLLDTVQNSPVWLSDPEVAAIVSETIEELAKKRYHLLAYCIMPNHVHLLIINTIGQEIPHAGRTAKYPITNSLRLLKGRSARQCNAVLGRKGAFWQHESYDHVVRDEDELKRIILYILQNPVKAHLVDNWRNWKFTYINPELGDW